MAENSSDVPCLSGNMINQARLKVLISAYACEPGKGSEPGVGWNWARQLGKYHDVWIITRANNRPVIERALEQEPLPGVNWVYFDLPWILRFWKRKQRGLRPYYYLWQIGIYNLAKKLHAKIKFDLAHHVTFVNYWLPSFLWKLPIPFIWGPVGGGERAPKSFYKNFSTYGRLYEYSREVLQWLATHDPNVRRCASKATLALATTNQTASVLAKLGAKNVGIYPAIGVAEEELNRLGSLPLRSSSPVRFTSSGRLLHLKGFDLGLKGFATLIRNGLDAEYWIFGDGPERNRLQSLARELGICHKVTFWGNRPRNFVLEKLAECDVLVHPSLHDSGGWVCLEAMAAGRPVICLDLGGPSVQVTHETGIKIPAISPEQAVHDIANAMLKLATSKELRHQMGEAGRKRVKEYFDWQRRGLWMSKTYLEVIQK